MKTALKTIAVVVLITAGRPVVAMPASPDVTVYFDVTKPNFMITATLTNSAGGNPSSTTAECSMAGSGYTVGTIEGDINSETGWNSMYGTYYGSEINLSSTFQVQAARANEGTSSTFTTAGNFSAEGVGPLEFSPTDQLLSGIYVYGEAGVCASTDTWALGLGQTFEGTAQSVTGTADNQFEQRDSYGSVVGEQINNQFTVNSTGGDSFSGIAEGGSYLTFFDMQSQLGFGISASLFSLDVQNNSSPTSIDVWFYTDQVAGETTTWYEHPDYPGQ